MPEIRDIAEKVRSKNAGPFWITIDIFCGAKPAYDRIREGLSDDAMARRLGASREALKRFDIPELAVIKLSLPRPAVQGTPADRDMHGAALANLVAETEIP